MTGIFGLQHFDDAVSLFARHRTLPGVVGDGARVCIGELVVLELHGKRWPLLLLPAQRHAVHVVQVVHDDGLDGPLQLRWRIEVQTMAPRRLTGDRTRTRRVSW